MLATSVSGPSTKNSRGGSIGLSVEAISSSFPKDVKKGWICKRSREDGSASVIELDD